MIKFTFFYGKTDVLSQCYSSKFTVKEIEFVMPEYYTKINYLDLFVKNNINIPIEKIEHEKIIFSSSKQFAMFNKAILFNDCNSAEKIINEQDPFIQEKYGKEILNFNNELWHANKENIVYVGNYHKFEQNINLRKELLNTNEFIVEANPNDSIWGIGLPKEDPRSLDETKWLGENLLGKILVKVRTQLRMDGINNENLKIEDFPNYNNWDDLMFFMKQIPLIDFNKYYPKSDLFLQAIENAEVYSNFSITELRVYLLLVERGYQFDSDQNYNIKKYIDIIEEIKKRVINKNGRPLK